MPLKFLTFDEKKVNLRRKEWMSEHGRISCLSRGSRREGSDSSLMDYTNVTMLVHSDLELES